MMMINNKKPITGRATNIKSRQKNINMFVYDLDLLKLS